MYNVSGGYTSDNMVLSAIKRANLFNASWRQQFDVFACCNSLVVYGGIDNSFGLPSWTFEDDAFSKDRKSGSLWFQKKTAETTRISINSV